MYFYYTIGFHYIRHLPSGPFGADDGISDADKEICSKILPNDIKLIHAYSWPDGSLYKYARTTKEMLRKDFAAILDGELARVAEVTSNPEPDTLGPIGYFTMEEKFLPYSNEVGKKLFDERTLIEHNLQKEYMDARHSCKTCEPGKLACDECMIVLRKCEVAIDNWRKQKIILPKPNSAAPQ